MNLFASVQVTRKRSESTDFPCTGALLFAPLGFGICEDKWAARRGEECQVPTIKRCPEYCSSIARVLRVSLLGSTRRWIRNVSRRDLTDGLTCAVAYRVWFRFRQREFPYMGTLPPTIMFWRCLPVKTVSGVVLYRLTKIAAFSQSSCNIFLVFVF